MTRAIRPIQSGELRHLCNIEQLVNTTDTHGVPGTGYVLWAENVFCAIDDSKPYEAMRAEQLGNELTTRIRIRYRPDVVPSMRIVWRTNPGIEPPILEYYEIQGVVRDLLLRVELQLTCVSRTSPGFRTGDAPNTAMQGVDPGGP